MCLETPHAAFAPKPTSETSKSSAVAWISMSRNIQARHFIMKGSGQSLPSVIQHSTFGSEVQLHKG